MRTDDRRVGIAADWAGLVLARLVSAGVCPGRAADDPTGRMDDADGPGAVKSGRAGARATDRGGPAAARDSWAARVGSLGPGRQQRAMREVDVRGKLSFPIAIMVAFAFALTLGVSAQAATPELSISNRLQDRRAVTAGQRSYVQGYEDGRFYANGFHITG